MPPRRKSSDSDLGKLLSLVRAACKRRGYSYRTEQTYVRWIVRYVRFHGTRHPREFEPGHVREYLSYLATERNVAASTQNQALNALLFLHRNVLGADWDGVHDFIRAKEPDRLPVVRTRREVGALIAGMEGTNRLVAALLYGAGLRISEALRLRIKDLDSNTGKLQSVREKERRTDRRYYRIPLPAPSSDKSRRPVSCGLKTGKPVTERSHFRRPWPGSIPMPPWNGAGSTSFRHETARRIHVVDG